MTVTKTRQNWRTQTSKPNQNLGSVIFKT